MKFYLSIDKEIKKIIKPACGHQMRASKVASLPSITNIKSNRNHPIHFLVFLIASLIFTGLSCKTNTSKAPEDVIYYYPQKNMYFDSMFSKYYYSLNGGKSWDSIGFKGQGAESIAGEKIAIQRTGEKIWANNQLHRKTYHGVLLNIINNRTISLAKTADSVARVKRVVVIKAPPKVIEKDEEEPPPVKGLKKFLNKIFGKKKKPGDEKNQ